MKIRGLCLIASVFLSITARGDLTIVQKVEGTGSAKQITVKLKGDKARVEVTPEITAIIDNKSGEVLSLINSKKRFVRMSADKSKAIAELASKYTGDHSAAPEKAKLTATGRKETINGYETEEYVRESPAMKESYWIALKFPDSAAIVKQLQAVVPAAWNEVAKGMFDFNDFPGLPLRSVIKREGKEITSTMVSIKQDLLSDTEFFVPNDFQEVKIPNIPQMKLDKPAAPPSSSKP